MSSLSTPSTPARLSQGEFIALIAMLFATIALSIDAMLPALPEIAETLTPAAPNRAQLIVSTFFLGMGIGTLFVGPLSDAFGRKRVIIAGGVIYTLSALVCYVAQSFEVLLIARVIQGIGAAGPRAVSLAMVRDQYKGREMARIMSFAMMIFMLVPAVAPLMGQGIIAVAGWHAIFLVYIVFSLITVAWLGLRQPETLAPEARVPLSLTTLAASARDLFSRRPVLVAIVIQGLTMAVMVATISSIQPIFELHFARGETFPLWFAFMAGMACFGSFLNSRIVMRLGMRKVITRAFAVVLVLTLAHLALRATVALPEPWTFYIFLAWAVSLFGMMTLTMGNLNALAMEPVGHIAGFAASMIAAAATVLAVLVSAPIGQAFDGTPMPLIIGAAALIAASLGLMRLLR